jgi:hypothetical protein
MVISSASKYTCDRAGLAPTPSSLLQAAEKLFFEGVILSAAKDLLFTRAENKADPSVAQNRRNLRMTLLRVFWQPAKNDNPTMCPDRNAQS